MGRYDEELKRVKELMKTCPYTIEDFKRKELVKFEARGEELVGEIYIIDSQGGGIYWGCCPSVDVFVESKNCLYKHIAMVDLEKMN